MTVFGQNCLHRDAMEYYYGFVEQHMADVPEHIVQHVRRCLFCRSQIRRLKEIEAQAREESDSSRDGMNRDIIDILNAHFQHVGASVTCAHVKFFLPGLVIPAPGVRIPTPITVHVDHCPACKRDLDLLRCLGLEPGQLEQLSRLYREKAADPRLCRRARLKIPAFAAASLESLDPELRRHLCTCPPCRAQVYAYREKLREALPPDSPDAKTSGGDHVSMAGLFDYVVACEPAPAGMAETQARLQAGTHVRQCRPCLDAVQALHHVVYNIAERTDSGVATVYTTLEEAEKGPGAAAPYPDYPISVSVTHHKPALAAARPSWSRTAAALVKHTAFHSRLKPVLTAAVVAAALLPLALLFTRTATVSGITLAEVVQAFEDAPHVYVAKYGPEDELVRESWISRGDDDLCLLAIAGQERALYDLGAKRKYVNSRRAEDADAMDVGEGEYMMVRRTVDDALGFELRNIPANATWTRAPDGTNEEGALYELACTGQDRFGKTFFLRWTITIDPATKRPEEIREFTSSSAEQEWDYWSRTEFQYLTNDEMTAVMGEQVSSSGTY
jgi:hypothetical protein